MVTFWTILRWTGRALLALVLLIVVVYLGVNGWGLIEARQHRTALEGVITERIAAELPESTRRRDAVTVTGLGDPAASWSAQQCGIGHRDAGWIVDHYTQECTLEVARAWPVDDARTAFGAVRPPVDAVEPLRETACTEVTLPDPSRADSYGEGLVAIHVATAIDPEPYCLPVDGWERRRLIEGVLPDFAAPQGWLIITDRTVLVDEEIGCQHWSVLFCDDPFGGTPAWGSPPGRG